MTRYYCIKLTQEDGTSELLKHTVHYDPDKSVEKFLEQERKDLEFFEERYEPIVGICAPVEVNPVSINVVNYIHDHIEAVHSISGKFSQHTDNGVVVRISEEFSRRIERELIAIYNWNVFLEDYQAGERYHNDNRELFHENYGADLKYLDGVFYVIKWEE